MNEFDRVKRSAQFYKDYTRQAADWPTFADLVSTADGVAALEDEVARLIIEDRAEQWARGRAS